MKTAAARDTDILEKVEKATAAAQLFGADKTKFHSIYKALALGCHPDAFAKNPKLMARAHEAFEKLNNFYADVTGTGTSTPGISFGKWEVISGLTNGDIADLYNVRSAAGNGVLKLARSARDNDLMKAEVDSLKHLNDAKAGDAGKGLKPNKHADFQHYVPKLLDTMKVNGRLVNVLSAAGEGYIPLGQFNHIWRSGLPTFKHMVWMGNRALSALGYVHYRGIIHGAILPDHLLYSPETHNMLLVDWCYSARLKSGNIKAAVSAYKDLYAPEILRKTQPTSATDLYMLMKTLSTVGIQGGWPAEFKRILEWATAPSMTARPLYAWDVQEQWRAMAQKLYGDPKFVKLDIP